MSDTQTKWKSAAIEQWTADPCGPQVESAEPGTRPYFEAVVAGRDSYAPWMSRVLDYEGSRGLRVLDVGCGQGIDVYRYAAAGAIATGVDLTPRHVELAQSHLEAMGVEGKVVAGDAEALPFADNTFDRVSSNGVLHHTPDMPAALREVRRVLRPGGEARIIVYNRDSLHYWTTQFLYLGLLRGQLFKERSMEGVLSRNVEFSRIGARPLVRVHSSRQMRRLLSDAGIADVSTTVRHFHLSDSPFTYPLRRLPQLRSPELLERIGRFAGWYVIAIGRKQTTSGDSV